MKMFILFLLTHAQTKCPCALWCTYMLEIVQMWILFVVVDGGSRSGAKGSGHVGG